MSHGLKCTATGKDGPARPGTNCRIHWNPARPPCNNDPMEDLGRRDQGPAGRHFRRLGAFTAVLAVGLAVGVAPVIGDGLNRQPDPNQTVIVPTVPATEAQVASGAGNLNRAVTSAARRTRTVMRPVFVESRITDSAAPIVTEEGRGTYVGIKCPGRSIAISGGVLSSYINLLISSSSPNHPISGKYTPRMWWLTVTNVNIDGEGGPLAWRGLVNCISPVKLRRL